MKPFTDKEIEYLSAQTLGRLGTVGRDGAPHVVPVGFRLDAEHESIEVGGWGFGHSKKWHDVQSNPKVAFVVDDQSPQEGWGPRGMEIRGRAELHREGGEHLGPGRDREWIRILPERIASWGIDAPTFSGGGRKSRTFEKAI